MTVKVNRIYDVCSSWNPIEPVMLCTSISRFLPADYYSYNYAYYYCFCTSWLCLLISATTSKGTSLKKQQQKRKKTRFVFFRRKI